MTLEQKEKIKQSMLAHLKSKGYPNINNNQIVQELPALWNKLSKEGLIDEFVKKGFSYQLFVQAALGQRQKAEFFQNIKDKFGFKF